MRILLYCLLFFFVSGLYENSAYSLSTYQMKVLCKNNQRKSECIKNLKLKKLNLIKGNQIIIPVVPFKK